MPTATSRSDRSAWVRDAVNRFERPLLSYARWLLRDSDKAADAVADTFARLCEKPPAATHNGELPKWLFTVCRHRAIDMLRKDKRMNPLSESAAAKIENTDRHSDPSDAIETADTTAAAMRALATLPGNQQEVVRLKFQHDMSYKDIAAVTGLTVTNVGYLLHKAIKTLRHEFNDE